MRNIAAKSTGDMDSVTGSSITGSARLTHEHTGQQRHELNEFLRDAQPRAFRMLQIALRDEHTALDILQDSMLAFVRRYGQKTAAERAPLFYRVVQNRLRDHFRRQRIRNRWLSYFTDLESRAVDSQARRFDAAEPALGSSEQLDNEQRIHYIEQVLRRLSLRQQQAFLLRAWEGLSEQETAVALGVSVGSVKTHYSRARQALQAALNALDGGEQQSCNQLKQLKILIAVGRSWK